MAFFSSSMSRSKAVCASVVALSFCFSIPAIADTVTSDNDKSVDSAVEKLNSARKNSADLLAEYGVNQSEVTDAQVRVADAKIRLDDARTAVRAQEERIIEVNARLADAQEILRGISSEVSNTEKKISDSEKNVGRMASDMYKTGGLTTSDNTALSYMTGNAREVTEKAYLDYSIEKVTNRTLNAIDESKQLRSVLESSELRQQSVQSEIESLKQEETEMLRTIEEKRNNAENEKKNLDEELRHAEEVASQAKKNYEDSVAREKREAEELRKRQLEMKRLEEARLAKEKKLMALAKEAGKKYTPTFVADDGSKFFPLPLPTTTNRVTSSFGFRPTPAGTIDYGGAGGYVHAGIDYGVACGSPVKSTGDGEVFIAGWSGNSGIVVAVDHGIRGGKGFATRYHHLSNTSVKVGDKVKRGQVIGLSGTTGNSTGCHLHFETLVDGERKNPVSFVSK